MKKYFLIAVILLPFFLACDKDSFMNGESTLSESEKTTDSIIGTWELKSLIMPGKTYNTCDTCLFLDKEYCLSISENEAIMYIRSRYNYIARKSSYTYNYVLDNIIFDNVLIDYNEYPGGDFHNVYRTLSGLYDIKSLTDDELLIQNYFEVEYQYNMGYIITTGSHQFLFKRIK
jgi:hypothetical protein